MAEQMGTLRRTHFCGEVTAPGMEVTVGGFVNKIHNKGKLIFIDLRDKTGIVQLAFNEKSAPEVLEKAASCRSEYVLMARGKVLLRESPNPKLKTGMVEIFPDELKILAKAQTPPFEIQNAENVREELRLQYRYLDLRRESLQENLRIRHEVARSARNYFYENGFLEIETPMMMKSTPEGARDYLIPSRVHPGKFYALPQSPQIYKQLLMVAGLDRYIQLARCFRDEDLRADRQPEFTQIDLEMSFVDVDDILEMLEGFVGRLMKEVKGMDTALPLPRLTYREAMERYGSDKPDTRFGMEIQNLSETVQTCEFPAFREALEAQGSVRAIVAKNGASVLSRKEMDKLTEHAKGIGAKGLATIRWTEDAPSCSFGKFLKEGELEQIASALGMEKGDAALIAAGKDKLVLPVLGALRLLCGKKLELIPKGVFHYLWITEMPFFEWNEDTSRWDAMHHPFTMPLDSDLDKLDTDPGAVRAKAYDLVLNGVELCSGSIRITDFELQERMFRALGLTEEEIQAKFGFLVDAYRYGAPPHGGAGLGLDRLAMMLCETENLRDVTAFPKVQNASELMSSCPAEVDKESLEVLGIQPAPCQKKDSHPQDA